MIWTPRHRNNRDAAAILRQRGGRYSVSSRLFTLSFCPLPIDWWTSCFKLTLRSVSPLWSQELHYTMMAQDDDMMKMSISIYFKCQGWLPPYTPCVSIASCHSARGRKVRSSKYSLNIYLELILPSSLHCCCCRYLQICRYLLVCFVCKQKCECWRLVSIWSQRPRDPHYPHHAPNTGTAWIEMFAFLCNCRYFRPILCRIDLIDIFLHNF